MANFEDADRSEDFVRFFYDMIDSHRDQLLFYLDEDAIMIWFSRTIVGSKAISSHLKFQVKATKHTLNSVVTTGPIQYRQVTYDGNAAALGQDMGPDEQSNGNDDLDIRDQDHSREDENLSEDMDYLSLKDCTTPKIGIPKLIPVTPRAVNKRVRFSEQPFGDKLAVVPAVRSAGSTVHFLEADGYVDFFNVDYRDTSYNRTLDLQRPCTMKLGFTKSTTKMGTDVRVFIIIYDEGGITRRQNFGSILEKMQVD